MRVDPQVDAVDQLMLKSPMAVVEAQLDALQRGDIQGTCFDLASSRFRRAVAPRQRFEQIVRERPELRPLVACGRYEVLSALRTGPREWKCRVNVTSAVGSMPFSVEYAVELRQHDDTEVRYDLGQCMTHKTLGYRGVVIGWDSECRMSDDWCRSTGVHELTHGREQPFYHVLVDKRDQPGSQIAYVAQESIVSADVTAIDHVHFQFTFADPGASFTGEVDEERGTWRPSPALREQYPLGLDGCWLVDRIFPDPLAAGFDA